MESNNHSQTASVSGGVSLQLHPLSDSMGAEIIGLDMTAPCAQDVQAALRQALVDHQVLLFRNQNLNEEQQVRFASIFGKPRKMWQGSHYQSQHEQVHYLSNVNKEGRPVGIHPDPDSAVWHSDGSWSRQRVLATVLNAVQIPEQNGNTHFANMYQVCQDLDQVSKERLGKLKAEHHYELTRAARYGRWPWQWWQRGPNRRSILEQLKWWGRVMTQRWRDGAVLYPVVRIHPDTHRPVLFIGDHAFRIADRPWPIGIRQMQSINAMPINENAIYVHHWQTDDLLIWDNTSLLHKVGDYDLNGPARIMRRSVVME